MKTSIKTRSKKKLTRRKMIQHRPRMEQLSSRMMMAGDLAAAEKGESASEEPQAEVATEKGRDTGEATTITEESENLEGSQSQTNEIDDAAAAELAEMSVDMLFGTEVLNDAEEDQMEQAMTDLISDVANGMSASFNGTDEFLSMETLIESIDREGIADVAAALSSAMDSGITVGVGSAGPGNDWLLPTDKAANNATKLVGDSSMVLGFTPAAGVATPAAVADVGIRVVNDVQDGTARFGTGTAITFTTTAIVTGAMVGGPAGAVIGAVVGFAGWLVGQFADEGDAAVEAKKEAAANKADTPPETKTDAKTDTKKDDAKTEEKAEATTDEKADDAKSATTPSDGPSFEEQLQFLQYLLATSPAFRQTMTWIQQSKVKGNIDPPRHQQDLGDTLISDTSGKDGFVNPGTPSGTVNLGSPSIPPAQGGDIDFGPDVVQSFEANHRPGESDVPTDVGRSSGTIASPATSGQNTSNATKGA